MDIVIAALAGFGAAVCFAGGIVAAERYFGAYTKAVAARVAADVKAVEARIEAARKLL